MLLLFSFMVIRVFFNNFFVAIQFCRFGTVVSVNVVKAQNLIIAPETNEVGDIVSAIDQADVAYDDTKRRTEVQPGSDHHDLGELGSTEPSSSHKLEETVDADVHSSYDDQNNNMLLSSRVSKLEDGAEAMKINSISEDKLMDNLEKDQVQQLIQVDESAKVVKDSANPEGSDISKKKSNQLDVFVDETEIPEDSIEDNSHTEVPQVENKFLYKQEKNGKENSMLHRPSSDLNHSLSEGLDGTENDGKKGLESDHWNVFEPGCVLVEFRRTEASCMAAHCLHGRLFDEHVVTVGYVDLNSYRNRFPK